MNKIFVFMSVFLIGCSEMWNVYDMETLPDKGDAFDVSLHAEYVKLAKLARDVSDWDNVLIFVQRGRWAAEGESPNIEAIGSRKIKEDFKDIVENAYNRADSVFSHGARMKNAEISAKLQAAYECMSYYAEKKDEEEAFFECRNHFENYIVLFENIEKRGADGIDMEQNNWFIEKDTVDLPIVGKTKKNILELLDEKLEAQKNVEMLTDFKDMEISRESYFPAYQDGIATKKNKTVIYYAFNKSRFDNAYSATISAIINEYLQKKIKKITILGYSDTTGSSSASLHIAKLRAKYVAEVFEKAGVNKSDITVKWYGDKKPAIATKDEVSEIANRRVEIETE